MKRGKILLIAGITVLTLAVLIILGAVFAGNYIENELQDMQVGAFSIESSNVDVNILQRKMSMSEVVIDNHDMGVKAVISEIVATGIGLFPLIVRNRLIINNVEIMDSELTIIGQGTDERMASEQEEAAEADWDIDFVSIKKLDIGTATFLLQNITKGEKDSVLALQAGIELWNLTLNSEREQLSYGNHSVERFRIRMSDGIYFIPGGLYNLGFDTLVIDSDQAELKVENLQLTTLHTKYDLGKFTGVETDWYKIVIPHFELKGIETESLLTDSAFIFQKASVHEMDAHIFRDKRPPFPDKPDTKLPMEMLGSLPIPFHADSVLIINSKVVYEEFGEESSEPGYIFFESLYASIYNLSTIPDLIDGQTGMSARALLMGSSLLEAEFVFPNEVHPEAYRVSGKLNPLDIPVLNPILEPSAFVRVEEGNIRRLEFGYTYDNNRADGNLELEYENLNISLLDKEDGSKKVIKTIIAETFIISKENLKEKNSYTEGTISFDRDKKKSVFNYWWKSVFSGIKDILL